MAFRRLSDRMTRAIDSSVILAFVFNEPGGDTVPDLIEGGLMSTVNLAEIVTKCALRNVSDSAALNLLQSFNVEIIAYDEQQAMIAGQLRAKPGRGALSLGDRSCIALALTRNVPALTADRIWADLDVGCPIEVIR